MTNASIGDGRHHDTRRVLQANMAGVGVPPHVADMILNHAIEDAPSLASTTTPHHYIPEKREAPTRWVARLTKLLGYDPNLVMKAERTRFQGKGPARRLGRRETYSEGKARLAAAGRNLGAEGRQLRQGRRKAARLRPAAAS